jgi:hypothetical protein
MEDRTVEGIEIPYDLEHIKQIDPDLVGHATLFDVDRNPLGVVTHIEGRLRDLLVADFRRRPPEQFPKLIMYSGCRL